jgi:diphthamide biosynthesis methyltransferase
LVDYGDYLGKSVEVEQKLQDIEIIGKSEKVYSEQYVSKLEEFFKEVTQETLDRDREDAEKRLAIHRKSEI